MAEKEYDFELRQSARELRRDSLAIKPQEGNHAD